MELPKVFTYSRSRLFLVLLLLLLGLFFRTVNLANPVYWVDEVATSIRVAGYTRAEVVSELADGRLLQVEDLQHYQHLSAEKNWSDTLAALQHSPEHAPLYFLLARAWSHAFGSSVVAMRSFSVLLSVLALPCLFVLSWELFASVEVAALAMGLLAVSPFFVAYAQEARPYSLWSGVLLVNGWLLLRALRCQDKFSWWGYGITAAVALYTSLLSSLVLLAQGMYVRQLEQGRWSTGMRNYLLAFTGAIGVFTPWLGVMAQHWGSLQDNTTWSRSSLGILPMLMIWLYNVAVLYFDVPVVASPVWIGLLEVLIALAVAGLIGFAVYFLCQHSAKWQWLFVLSLIVAIPGWLILLDLVRGNQLSTAARYMIPSQLGIQLAMAYLLVKQPVIVRKNNQQHIWKGIICLLITLSLISCLFQLKQPPKYQKSRNLHNQPIATILNQAQSPLVWAEPEQAIDLISLSYTLKPEIEIQFFAEPFADFFPKANSILTSRSCQNVFLFNPSTTLKKYLQSQSQWKVEEAYQPQRLIADEIALSLWSIAPLDPHCSS